MPVDRTIPKPLSGEEIVEAIVTKIRAQLNRDCYLAKHIAYGSFSFQADIRVQFQRTGTSIKETNAVVHGMGGDLTEAEMESVDLKVEDVEKPPNQVRVETGQGVPALVAKPTGGVQERKIKYANKPAVTSREALTR